jgi:hypothetical protein
MVADTIIAAWRKARDRGESTRVRRNLTITAGVGNSMITEWLTGSGVVWRPDLLTNRDSKDLAIARKRSREKRFGERWASLHIFTNPVKNYRHKVRES